METSRELSKWLIYSLLGAAADALDTVLSALTPSTKPTTSLLPSDVDGLCDEEILELREQAEKLHPDCAVFRLTPHTVGKASQDVEEDAIDASEANAINLVFAGTTVPVPRVRRVVKDGWYNLIVMDYVKGRTLAEVWPTYSVWKKIRVAFTLRRYVRQLRRLKATPSTPPGPLSVQGPRICEVPSVFGQVRTRRGPFASYAELSSFFNQRRKMACDGQKLREDHPWRKERFDDSFPLVLTHNDLNPRNIIVGDDGLLWVVDWAWAGYYPLWFEYVAMQAQLEHEEDIGFKYDSWERLIPFISGPYFKQDRWLSRISLGLYYG